MENSGFVKADILEPSYKPDLHVFICHQVNCRGVMGAGLAKQVATRYSRCIQGIQGVLPGELL